MVSSKDAETRRNDYEEKVVIYQRVRIPEYLILDSPSRITKNRFLLTSYRLGENGRYRKIQPADLGRLLSETTNLLFAVSENGRTVHVIDATTGNRLLTPEERATREIEARQAMEAELANLRAELERRR